MAAEKFSSGAVVEVFFLARQEVRGEKLARLEASGVLSSCILDLRDTGRGISGCVWVRGVARRVASLQGARCAGRQGDIEGGGARQCAGPRRVLERPSSSVQVAFVESRGPVAGSIGIICGSCAGLCAGSAVETRSKRLEQEVETC
jgi:hypothetical protein